MLSAIGEDDFGGLRVLVGESVRSSIEVSEEAGATLIGEIVESLDSWRESGSPGFHRKYCVGDEVAGFIIVKDYWSLSHLFVCPEFQGRGIGRVLVEAALEGCRNESPCRKIQLNSSTNAAGFYRAVGFRQTGSGLDRPGGCIPFEYNF